MIGLERNWSRAGAMMTTFAGSLSLPQTIHQNDGDISAVASARLRRLARAVRYITSPKRRRNCVSSNRSSMVSALSRTIALNSSLSEAHSLGLSITRRIGPQRNRHLTYGSLLLRPPHGETRPSCRNVSDALLRVSLLFAPKPDVDLG